MTTPIEDFPHRTRVLQHPHTHATREYTGDPFANRESACEQTGSTNSDFLEELPSDSPVTCPACLEKTSPRGGS